MLRTYNRKRRHWFAEIDILLVKSNEPKQKKKNRWKMWITSRVWVWMTGRCAVMMSYYSLHSKMKWLWLCSVMHGNLIKKKYIFSFEMWSRRGHWARTVWLTRYLCSTLCYIISDGMFLIRLYVAQLFNIWKLGISIYDYAYIFPKV